MRILITRPEPDGSDLAATLADRGHAAIVAPMLEIAALPERDLDLTNVSVVIFTSRNALRAVEGWRQFEDLKTRTAFCVGARTEAELKSAGFMDVAVHSATAADLAHDMIPVLSQMHAAAAAKRILHLSGDEVATDVAGALQAHGYDAERAIVYRARMAERLSPEAATALAADGIDCATFYSPRTAATFAAVVEASGLTSALHGVVALCLSAQVADGLGKLGGAFRDIRIARNPKGQEMLALIDLVAAELHQ